MSMRRVAGVDEAGRGPLAGPVVAAAVILHPLRPIADLADSKKLSPQKRGELECAIKRDALCWSAAAASVEEIERLNILQASLLAMQRAVAKLKYAPDFARVDGNKLPQLNCPAEAVVRGDALHAEISAASILAKQSRDRIMRRLAVAYPQYAFERHKGYPTAAHLREINDIGVTRHHRRTFAPIKNLRAVT